MFNALVGIDYLPGAQAKFCREVPLRSTRMRLNTRGESLLKLRLDFGREEIDAGHGIALFDL